MFVIANKEIKERQYNVTFDDMRKLAVDLSFYRQF